MNLREFTKEDIPRAIASWLRNRLPEAKIDLVLDGLAKEIESGKWLKDLEQKCK